MNKRGFTLVELLAVIVLLAIITVIATPRILDLIQKTDKQAYKESVELIMRTVKIQYDSKEINNTNSALPITYIYIEGVQVSPAEILQFKGDKPYSGSITLTTNKKIIINNLISKNQMWCAKKTENQDTITVGTPEELNCN